MCKKPDDASSKEPLDLGEGVCVKREKSFVVGGVGMCIEPEGEDDKVSRESDMNALKGREPVELLIGSE